MRDVMRLIDELDDAVNSAKSGLIGSQVKVDKERAYAIMDQMRATIPEEIKQARWINKERQEMLAEATRERERILEAAREEPPARGRAGRARGRGRPRGGGGGGRGGGGGAGGGGGGGGPGAGRLRW